MRAIPRDKEKILRKNKKARGSDLTLGFVVFRFQVLRNHKGITHFQKIFPQNLLKSATLKIQRQWGRSVSIRIERRVLGVITHLVSPRSVAVKPETFKDRKLNIFQASEQAKTRIF
jgi:hypothetical protein